MRTLLPTICAAAASVLSLATAAERPPALFVDRAEASGLKYSHVSGARGELHYHELMGAGCALLDYDNDGDLDVYLVQSGEIPEKFSYRSELPANSSKQVRDRLFRNDLDPTSGRLRFIDVTASSGLSATGYGMGVTTGDVNNDGWVDLYLTNYGPDQLWINNRDGTFTDATAKAGLEDHRFTVGATFVDIDRDGWLDLYVVGYVDYRYETKRRCLHPSGAAEYCAPSAFAHLADRLLRNRGDGTFEDRSKGAGIAAVKRSGLGVVAVDANDDGWMDLYVGNDQGENLLWINREGSTFTDEALLRGCALAATGQSEASMGVAAGDLDGDGDEDLFAAHMNRESNRLFINHGKGLFDDRSAPSGLGAPGWRHTTYAGVWLDYDNDGLLDVMMVNGGMVIFNEMTTPTDPDPLADSNQLFHNLGRGRFEEVTGSAGNDIALWDSGRGAAVGDIDNDGDADVLISNKDGPARLLLNRAGSSRPWLGLRLIVDEHGRDALGALVTVIRDGATAIVRRVAVDGSYGSARDPRVLIGLGDHPAVSRVHVLWPDGQREVFRDLPMNRYTTLVQGAASKASVSPVSPSNDLEASPSSPTGSVVSAVQRVGAAHGGPAR